MLQRITSRRTTLQGIASWRTGLLRFALLIVLSLFVARYGQGLGGYEARASGGLVVSRIIDGDTFELSDGRKVRLIGVDAPEKRASAKLRRDARESGTDEAIILLRGMLASEYASGLVFGEPVELVFDSANATKGHVDLYGRILAYVWVLDEHGHPRYSVNERMIADGYGYAYTRYPFEYREKYLRLQREAREQNRGLYAVDVSGDLGLADGEYRTCSDFETRDEAQAFFLRAGGTTHGPYWLDGGWRWRGVREPALGDHGRRVERNHGQGAE